MAEVIHCRPCMDTSSCGNSSSVSSLVVHHRQGQGSTRPKWRAYSKRRTRRKSFDGAADMLVQQANYFSKLGFFYKGYGKQIVCFQCGVEIEVKEGVHDYHTEHSYLAPHCPFVRQLDEDGQSDGTDSEDQNDHQINNTTRNGIASCKHFIMADVMKNCKYAADFTGNSNFGHSSSPDGATLQPRQSLGTWRPKWRAYSKRRTRCKSFDGAAAELASKANHFAKLGFFFKDVLPSVEPMEDSDQVLQSLRCKVCLDKQVRITFQPCGHLAACDACASRLTKCPVCRANIRDRIKTYLS
ncbi:hypothetical protein FSP39_020516 [Pinctada imbricata]|uniref:RING-type domain-containing protein n=1 Tax=Pinctada imbricata TaxID=66713 RepID=A0AA88Y669_PINIB|nr:hypothetical protein FSP39_020516 [Pinctada imbricata]